MGKFAMERCLKQIYSASETRWNVMSIGDSRTEQQALKELLPTISPTRHRALCKTIKLRDTPSLAELDYELQLLIPRLQRLVAYGKDFDKAAASLSILPSSLWLWLEGKSG